MKQMLQMMAAVMLGGVTAAGEVVPTVVEGATYQFGNTYAGPIYTQSAC